MSLLNRFLEYTGSTYNKIALINNYIITNTNKNEYYIENHADEIEELKDYLMNSSSAAMCNLLAINSPDLEFLRLYEKIAFDIWIRQNSSLKIPSIRKNIKYYADQILKLKGYVIIHTISTSGKVSALDIGSNDGTDRKETEERLNNYLYALVNDYKSGGIYVHELNDNYFNHVENVVNENKYILEITKEGLYPFDINNIPQGELDDPKCNFCQFDN